MLKLTELLSKTNDKSNSMLPSLRITEERGQFIIITIRESIKEDEILNKETICIDRVLANMERKGLVPKDEQELFYISLALGKIIERGQNPMNELSELLGHN